MFPLLLVGFLALEVSATSQCLSGDACFPSLSTLDAFNSSIGGKLHAERPIGAVCYVADTAYNASACADLTARYGDDQYRSDLFGDYEQINWETCGVKNACLVPAANGTTCGQGSVPSYAVHATTAADVQAYVKFATKYNLRIVIKNTGHDYAGRSSGKGGFALWTHGLQGVSHNKTFVPAGCTTAPQDSLTAASGVQWETLYQFADDEGVLVVGGDSNQVGAAGGWIQGGGHSVLSPTYGLGVDNLLEVEIVTPDGNLQTVNECTNPDLFWAIRGGGPSTWGVLTKVTYKAHPAVAVPAVFINFDSGDADANAKVVGDLAAISPNLADLGVGGFLEIFETAISYFGILPGGNLSTLQAAIKPLSDALPANATAYQTFPSFLQFFAGTFKISNEVVGIPFALTSRLIPRHYFENDPQGLAAAIRQGQVVSGPEAATQFIQVLIDNPAPKFAVGKTSVTPAWYSSLWHVIYTGTWNVTTPVAGQRAEVKYVHDAAQVLRDYAPDSGSYINEADIYEPNHEESFWGAANAARLKTIKAEVDPQNFFQVWQGIGWDGSADSKFQCYQELNPGDVSLDN
ncbi:FAD-binding domain-containing protein [Auriscalpium vulgare]|uniref:FAD-binding domain-containing protein n=1 Tax=Auriscalpium vulgare TaxID=40419 RepID=A0ACB8RLX0_9AGAM|nr:FAD-binding domain-containing protein [Auriscalpium vulgare]